MQNASAQRFPPVSDAADNESATPAMGLDPAMRNVSAEMLPILHEIIRMLPSPVTVQDGDGAFLLVNDAAAAQFGTTPASFQDDGDASDFLRQALSHRRLTARNLIQSGRTAVFEERVDSEHDRRIFLTTHRPVTVDGRALLLSSASDVSRQKQVEQDLFRRAYYDELTDLPTRRVIEKHVADLIAEDIDGPERTGRFALAFLDIDNFKHINDYYGHSTGDGLLVQFAKRIGFELRSKIGRAHV